MTQGLERGMAVEDPVGENGDPGAAIPDLTVRQGCERRAQTTAPLRHDFLGRIPGDAAHQQDGFVDMVRHLLFPLI